MTDHAPLLYKAVTPGYTSRNLVRWKVGEITRHPKFEENPNYQMTRNDPNTYLSLSTHAADTLIATDIPCRVLVCEPIGTVLTADSFHNKRSVLAAKVVKEIEPWQALGPCGRDVAALIDMCAYAKTEVLDRLAHTMEAQKAEHRGNAYDRLNEIGMLANAEGREHAVYQTRYKVGDALVSKRPYDLKCDFWSLTVAATAFVVRDLLPENHLFITPIVDALGPADTWPTPEWCQT